MAKSKKKLEVEKKPVLNFYSRRPTDILTVGTHLTSNSMNQSIKNCEWCFQFDDEEPTVFASTTEGYSGKKAKLSFGLTNDNSTNLTFKDNKTGKTFKIFARTKQL